MLLNGGSSEPFLSDKYLKLKTGLLTGCAVAVVTFCVTKMTITCLPVIGHLIDAIIMASTEKEQ